MFWWVARCTGGVGWVPKFYAAGMECDFHYALARDSRSGLRHTFGQDQDPSKRFFRHLIFIRQAFWQFRIYHHFSGITYLPLVIRMLKNKIHGKTNSICMKHVQTPGAVI